MKDVLEYLAACWFRLLCDECSFAHSEKQYILLHGLSGSVDNVPDPCGVSGGVHVLMPHTSRVLKWFLVTLGIRPRLIINRIPCAYLTIFSSSL